MSHQKDIKETLTSLQEAWKTLRESEKAFLTRKNNPKKRSFLEKTFKKLQHRTPKR